MRASSILLPREDLGSSPRFQSLDFFKQLRIAKLVRKFVANIKNSVKKIKGLGNPKQAQEKAF